MTTKIHDSNHCDCEMCQFAQESIKKPLKSPSLTYYGHPRLDVGLDEFLAPEPESGLETILAQSSPIPAAPDFDHEWREAPRGMTNYVERSVAEYFYLRGRRAGELSQIIEENRVFREMAERRGLRK